MPQHSTRQNVATNTTATPAANAAACTVEDSAAGVTALLRGRCRGTARSQVSRHIPRLHPRQVLRRVPHGSAVCAAIITAALGAAIFATLAAALDPELAAAVPADLAVELAAELAIGIVAACRGMPRALPRRAASLAVTFHQGCQSACLGPRRSSLSATRLGMRRETPRHPATSTTKC